MRPDIKLFHQHISEAAFQANIDRGYWGIYEQDETYPTWPAVIIWVSAAYKEGAPDRYYFKFDLMNYPASAPTACPWDIARGSRLESDKWPKGNGLVSQTFRPGWNPNALYAPCDRIAMSGHEGWQQQFPHLWWQAHFKISIYLHFVHQLLNSSDYGKSRI